jgi:hypothetical protein
MHYDLIIVGDGLAGASLAKGMAELGRPLVPHWALASGDNAKSLKRIRVSDQGESWL